MRIRSHSLSLLLFAACAVASCPVLSANELEVTAEVAKLKTLDPEASDQLGNSVSLDGDRLAAGVYLNDDDGVNSGSAYLFERSDDGLWSQTAKLVGLDTQDRDRFGKSISLDGNRVAVGAVQSGDTGAVYIFERDANGSWIEVARLTPTDGSSGERFGSALSLQGDRLAVGAIGALAQDGTSYVFERDGSGNWSQIARLRASPLTGSFFGEAISLDGDRLAIGARGDERAFIFERAPDGSWIETTELLGPDGFGVSLSLEGDRLLIGADLDNDLGDASGSAYLFERDGDGNWSQTVKLLAPDGQENARFGGAVSLDGDQLAIGSAKSLSGLDGFGETYLFERDAAENWNFASKLQGLGVDSSDQFGIALALDGDRVAVGALRDDDRAGDSGAIYIFDSVLVSPEISVTGTCPGEVQVSSSGLTPRSRFGLYGSASEGTWELERQPCGEVTLGLDAPRLLTLTNSDFDASGTLVRTVDASWCSSFLQLVDERTCLTSDVVQLP